ncbi:MAG TPA: hypothetical protein VN668_22605 [Stellaceae bacterium]|nr:hypothetical protein [Stellaceae bacterium]
MRGRLEAEVKALGLAELPDLADVNLEISGTHTEAETLADAISATEGALEGSKAAHRASDEAFRGVERRLEAARTLLETKTAELAAGRKVRSDEELASHAAALVRHWSELRSALTQMEQRRLEAPETVAARIRRLEAAGGNHRSEASRLNTMITRLGAHVEAAEGAGLEEAIERTKLDLERLEAAVATMQEEAAALELLLTALRQAESEAKARYLAPVTSRVEPYLRMCGYRSR